LKHDTLISCSWYIRIHGPIDECWIPRYYSDDFVVNVTVTKTNYQTTATGAGYRPSIYETILTRMYGNHSLHVLVLYLITTIISSLLVLTGILQVFLRLFS
jgi:hypothetical protein